jgi:phage terminase large subunit
MGKPLPRPEGGTYALDYTPRPQFVAFHERKQRNAVMICHRRAGKTIACALDLIMRALAHSKTPEGKFAFISPTYTQAKDICWEYLKHYSAPFLRETPNESELRVNFWNGSQVRLYGGDNPDALRGLGFDAVVFDEYADCSPGRT